MFVVMAMHDECNEFLDEVPTKVERTESLGETLAAWRRETSPASRPRARWSRPTAEMELPQ